jgi:hypothetical protein
MSITKINDCKFGNENEIIILPIIRKFFNRDIIKLEDKYNKYDYEDDIYKYELKARKNNYNKYPTTLIGSDKYDNKYHNNKKIIFLFNFTDGLYYIEYDKDKFNTFEKKPFVRIYRGVNDIKKDYLFIPIEHLIKIN